MLRVRWTAFLFLLLGQDECDKYEWSPALVDRAMEAMIHPAWGEQGTHTINGTTLFYLKEKWYEDDTNPLLTRTIINGFLDGNPGCTDVTYCRRLLHDASPYLKPAEKEKLRRRLNWAARRLVLYVAFTAEYAEGAEEPLLRRVPGDVASHIALFL